ncbi:signal peptide peptidase SppA [Methanosarcina sp. MSH10X1]|uniref:signal peptide peptidase SppA n=1 Tax=Methanosarcina sp. MSH10X1 TaxID=2507075 RepID=UPI000FFB1BCC|nr:signal peptide peptidase SppA [Methanosarcina sp. MSH10X1]RXA19020.1 signal peptide peptidase SppA [Methanosarcina sp. MSH10X1]
MNDKNINPDDMNSEELSGDDNLQNNFHNGKQDFISDNTAYGMSKSSSGSGFGAGGSGKAGNKGASFENSQNKEIENKSLSMNSNPPPQGKKHGLMPYLLVVLALIAVILVSIAVISFSFGAGGDLRSSEKVAVIYIQGTILSGNVPAGLGYATSEEISESIRRAAADSGVRAIVLRINSPGGSPAAAQEITGEIEKARAKGIPVVVSMGDLATSAAYYISAPTDYIIANPSTNTGSIGVIWVFQNMSASYQEEGIDHYIAKSGELKDMGSTWRGLTDEEKEYADAVVLESYEDFINEISEGRNMSRSEVKELADGRIYTGARAKELGLVDGFGNLYDAIDKAAELGGIEGEPRIEYMNRASLSRLLLGSGSGGSNETAGQFVSYFEESPYGKILA